MNDLMKQAASGNHDALDTLCAAALERAKDTDRDRGMALAEALVFARLARQRLAMLNLRGSAIQTEKRRLHLRDL